MSQSTSWGLNPILFPSDCIPIVLSLASPRRPHVDEVPSFSSETQAYISYSKKETVSEAQEKVNHV